MIFRQIESGGDRNYAYLIASEKTLEGALIDPSTDPIPVIKAVEEEGVEIKYVINTHSHLDHSQGNEKFRLSQKGKLVIFINCGLDTGAEESKSLYLGELSLELI